MQRNKRLDSFSIDGVHCEIYGGRWPGPVRRGRTILEPLGEAWPVLPPRQAVEVIRSLAPAHFPYIEALIFYPKAATRADPLAGWLPFVACHTGDRFVARQALFDAAEEVARATGWYLLVSGRYLHREGQRVPGALRRAASVTTTVADRDWGGLRRVRSISGRDNGTALLLELDGLTVQLDTGFRDPGHHADLVVVSHAHRDHSGGVETALRRGQRVLMSEATYELLRGWRWKWADHLAVVRPGFYIESPDGGKLEWFTGYHTHDAVMLRLTDHTGQQLLYTGDLSLGNGFFREHPDELCRYFDADAPHARLLADACFWGRQLEHRDGLTTRHLEDRVRQAVMAGRDVVFTASSPDYLYPLYLWFFRHFNSGVANLKVPTVLASALYDMLHSGYRAFTLDKRHQQDVFVRHVMNHSFAAYLGSVHVYSPSELRVIAAHSQKAVSFVGPADLELVPSDAVCFVLGNPYREETQALLTACRRFRDLEPLFGQDFSFHATSEDVTALFTEAATSGIDVLAFHASRDQVRRAVQRMPATRGQVAHVDDFDWSEASGGRG